MRRRSYSSDRAGRAFPGRSRRRGVVFNVQCSGLVSDEGNGGEAVPPPLPSRAFLPEDLSVSASVRHTHTHTQLSSFPPPATRKTGNVGTKTAALKVQRAQRVQSTGCRRRRRGCQVPGARCQVQDTRARGRAAGPQCVCPATVPCVCVSSVGARLSPAPLLASCRPAKMRLPHSHLAPV